LYFFNKFNELCATTGISPSRAALDMGIHKGTVSVWRNNVSAKPSADTLKKISDYFKVSVSELLDEQEIKKPALETEDGQTASDYSEYVKQTIPLLPVEAQKMIAAQIKIFLSNQ
jgi:transcriptional regulator with XRE-family HTH domain